MSAAAVAVILGVVLIGAELFSWLVPRTNNDKTTTIHLRKSPNQLNGWDIASLIGLIAWKHLIPSFGGYSPPLRKNPTASQEFILPEIETKGLLDIDDRHVKLFEDAVLQSSKASASSTDVNAFFLVAQTVPLAVQILANRNGPIKPFGTVNTKNIIRFIDPRRIRDVKSLKDASRDGRLSYAAIFGGSDKPGYRRKRGVECQINITISYDGVVILDSQLWFLQPLSKAFQPRYQETQRDTAPQATSLDANTVVSGQTLSLTAQDPQRWASSSKDYNPIHVSPLGAKLFGFRSVIAHGNHVAALAMQSLQNDPSKSAAMEVASQMFWESERAFELTVSFLRPVLLPTRLSTRFVMHTTSAQVDITVSKDDKPHLEISLAWV